MKDKLENFIDKRRDSFDTETPSEDMWNRIEGGLTQPGSAVVYSYGWVWKVAAVFFLGLSTYLLVERNTLADAPVTKLSSLEEEFVETEAYYVSLIELKRTEIEHLDIEKSKVQEELELDINELGTYYNELKAELKSTGNPKVLDAMIDNLRLRMELLNRELEILKKLQTNNHEHTS